MDIKDDERLNEIYQQTWALIGQLSEKYSGAEVAGVLAVQALTIYKTILSENEYNMIVNSILSSKDQIKKIELPNIQ